LQTTKRDPGQRSLALSNEQVALLATRRDTDATVGVDEEGEIFIFTVEDVRRILNVEKLPGQRNSYTHLELYPEPSLTPPWDYDYTRD
jgi:hypothetical protein